MRDEFVSAFAAFRAGDPAPLKTYLDASTCIACEGPGPLTGGYCKACHDDICAHFDRHADGCRCPECHPDWNSAEAIARDEARLTEMEMGRQEP